MNSLDYAEFVQGMRARTMDTVGGCLGLAGETGELVDAIKKWKYHQVGDEASVTNKVLAEAGDVLFYLTLILGDFGLTLEDATDYNYDKLWKRYPNGFIQGGGIRDAEQS